MHRFSAGTAVSSFALLAALAADNSADPDWAVVVPLVVVFIVAVTYWALTSDRALERWPMLRKLPGAARKADPPPVALVSADHGSSIVGGNAYQAGGNLTITQVAELPGQPALGFGETWQHDEFVTGHPPATQGGEMATFVGVYVTNVGSAPARNVWAQISFFAPDQRAEPLRSFMGRWSGRSPAPELGMFFEAPEYTEIDEIPPNERSEPLDVAVRFKDGTVNGFNTRNLYSGGRHDEVFSIDVREFVVAIRVKASGGVNLYGEWTCSSEDFHLRHLPKPAVGVIPADVPYRDDRGELAQRCVSFAADVEAFSTQRAQERAQVEAENVTQILAAATEENYTETRARLEASRLFDRNTTLLYALTQRPTAVALFDEAYEFRVVGGVVKDRIAKPNKTQLERVPGLFRIIAERLVS